MTQTITAATVLAGVIGRPVRHSLSPLIHNAWLEAAGIDGGYVALSPEPEHLPALIDGLRGGVMKGLNVTVPYKEQVLALADQVTERARQAGAANLLTFPPGGEVVADNTDGYGLLAAFAAQAPGFDPAAAPVVILGAGGASRGAAAAFVAAGAPEVRIVNRTRDRAKALAEALGESVSPFAWSQSAAALDGAGALVNATTLGLEGGGPLDLDIGPLPRGAVVMDMVYRPLHTPLLIQARTAGRPIVDGLEMLIRQAEPSFEAFFGRPPPATVDARALALAALGVS
ncbi:MAG TPA: shikimate dehydrogenase [Caulobacteraceae bacterium]|nr:shikimate dehydrogenase [Caulobacteraceae bacterium]